MFPSRLNLSREGNVYTKKQGLVSGVHTLGVIKPPQKIQEGLEQYVWDAIVVGGGYAGLIAARDLVKAGKTTLLIEARDRIGGRTWTAEVDGTKFEMGGTWISQVQGRLWSEMTRYGLRDGLSCSLTKKDAGCDYFIINTSEGSRKISNVQANEMMTRAWKIFVNIDGKEGRDICPLPHSILGNLSVDPEKVKEVDQLSCRDRLNQIKNQLSPDELAMMESLIPNFGGGSVEDMAFLEFLRCQALQGWSADNIEEYWTLYKIREGQSTLARRIFDDAVRLGLQYSFNTPVSSFSERDSVVSVHAVDGACYRARRVINTIPIAVLDRVDFDPPLSTLRQEAITQGQLNYHTKIHAEVDGDLRGLRGMTWPGDLLYVYGDGFCAGNKTTKVTAFSGDNRGRLNPMKDPEKLEDALQRFQRLEIKKIVFHDWVSDPYAGCGPAWYRPGFITKYLAELQKRHGNILMANADWAHGWRSFIEGAMEQGGMAADVVMTELGLQGANVSLAAIGQASPSLENNIEFAPNGHDSLKQNLNGHANLKQNLNGHASLMQNSNGHASLMQERM